MVAVNTTWERHFTSAELLPHQHTKCGRQVTPLLVMGGLPVHKWTTYTAVNNSYIT